MRRTAHHIRRAQVRLVGVDPARAFAARAQLRESWDAGLLPAMQRALDAAAPDGVVLRIPRIALTVRLDSLDELGSRLPGLVEAALRQALAQLGSQVPAPEAEDEVLALGWLRGEVPAPGRPAEEAPARRTRAGEGRLWLAEYLARGVLAGSALDQPPSRAALADLAEEHHTWLVAAFAQGAFTPAALFRWLGLLPAPAREVLVQTLLSVRGLEPGAPPWPAELGTPAPPALPASAPALPPGGRPAEAEVRGDALRKREYDPPETEVAISPKEPPQGWLAPLLHALLHEPPVEATWWWRRLAAALLSEAARAPQSPAEVAEQLRAQVPAPLLEPLRGRLRQHPASLEVLEAALARVETPDTPSAPRRAPPGQPPEPPPPGSAPRVDADPAPPPAARARGPEPTDGGPAAPRPAPEPEAAALAEPRSPREGPEPARPLAVYDAGMVLLHPYLGLFLDGLGVVEQGGIPEALRPRALSLLSRVLTGADEPEEATLGVCRLLLGLRPDDPVLLAPGLVSEADAEEADALLAAVITHWGALGHTSPAGLRATFLQRPGLVREADRGWTLTVQPAGYDLLLDRLPWGLSVVRLPWMPAPLFTTWERL